MASRHLHTVAIALMAGACGEHPTAPVQRLPQAVSIVFAGPNACAPLPGKPCAIELSVQVTNPDGGSLRYVWSGCARGASARATCVITQPGEAIATVSVADDRGQTTTASATAIGENHPPGVQIGYIVLLPTNSSIVELLGNVTDPDEELCGAQYCVSATAQGACGPQAYLACSCLGGLEAEVRRTAATGQCTVTFTVKDSWGQVGTPSVTFDVATERRSSHSTSPNPR